MRRLEREEKNVDLSFWGLQRAKPRSFFCPRMYNLDSILFGSIWPSNAPHVENPI